MSSEQNIRSIQSQTIDLFRIVLTFAVVCLHCSANAALSISNGLSEFFRLVLTIFGWLAVPAFFFLSGYFFFSKMNCWSWTEWQVKIRKRVKTLLIPYLAWNIIALFVIYGWEYLHNIQTGYPFGDYFKIKGEFGAFWANVYQSSSTNFLGYEIVEGHPIDSPMWYIRDLLVICLMSPILNFFLDKFKIPGLAALAILYILNIGFPYPGCSSKGLFFFCCGGYLMKQGKVISESFQTIKHLSYCMAFLLFIILISLYGRSSLLLQSLAAIYTIFGVVSLYNICDFYTRRTENYPKPFFVKSCFFVYAIHQIIILDLVNFLLWRLLPYDIEGVRLLKVFFRPIFSIALSMGLFALMERVAPKTLSLLTGGRQ